MNSENYVIEAEVRWCFVRKYPALVINRHVVGLHTDLRKHGGQNRGLIFAISVAMRKHFSRRMRTPPTNTNLDGGITNVMLSEPRQSPDAVQ